MGERTEAGCGFVLSHISRPKGRLEIWGTRRLRLFRSGRSDFPNEKQVACANLAEVVACFRETQRAIRAAADAVCIVLILAVVFPVANRTDFEPAPHG